MLHHFSPTGRLSRWPYFWRVIVLYLLAFACYGLPSLAEYQLHDTAAYWQNIALLGMAVCFYLMLLQGIKRLHDIDLRGWWLLLALVPIVSIVLGAGMQFIAGTQGPNRFGLPPGLSVLPLTSEA